MAWRLTAPRTSQDARTILGGLVATDVPPVVVEFGQLGGVQLTERGTRGCHQPSVVNANTDVSGTTDVSPRVNKERP